MKVFAAVVVVVVTAVTCSCAFNNNISFLKDIFQFLARVTRQFALAAIVDRTLNNKPAVAI